MDKLLALCAVLMFSGVQSQSPQQRPLDDAIAAYSAAREAGHSDEVAQAREQARTILEGASVTDPQFGAWMNDVVQLYLIGGREAQARAIVETALDRTAGLGDAHSARAMLLDRLADLWEQDRNLLRAVALREQFAAAQESGPAYRELARLYRALGRRDHLQAVLEKLRHISGNDLAAFYEQDGQLDRAASLYREQAERVGAQPQERIPALEALAEFYDRQERRADARTAFDEAIGIAETCGQAELSGKIRMRLANLLQQSGQSQAADQIYAQALAAAPGDLNVVNFYANHLSSTGRGGEAEAVLRQYMSAHPDQTPGGNLGLQLALANAAGATMEEGQFDKLSRLTRLTRSAYRPDRADEAFRLTMEHLDRAPEAADREQISLTVPSVAVLQVTAGMPERADQLYRRALALAEGWSADTLQPLAMLQQNFARFLIEQKRWDDLPVALDRYRETLLAAHGASSGWMEDILRLHLDAAAAQQDRDTALAASQELLRLDESLSGIASEPYLAALELRIPILETNGQADRALDLRRQAVSIADAALPRNDPRRGYLRMQAALALARRKQFDEAARMAAEAVAAAPDNRFTSELQEILRLISSARH